MINIRSVTIGVDTETTSTPAQKKRLTAIAKTCKARFEENDRLVRTMRLVLPPIRSASRLQAAGLNSLTRWVDSVAADAGIRWFCVPFHAVGLRRDERERFIAGAREVITRFPNAFVNWIAADDGTTDRQAAVAAARLVRDISRMTRNGFDNFRLGVSCNCPDNAPFFPFSKHAGGTPKFSLALETAESLLGWWDDLADLDLPTFRETVLQRLTDELRVLQQLATELADELGIEFAGMDASLAPFPDGETSVGRIIELLGVDGVGSSATVFMTSFLTDLLKTAIKRAGATPAGFNGVMYSLLEDDYLAKENDRRAFTMESFLAFSSVCGCGLDMIPIPGDTLEGEIAALVLDVAALSTSLNKPLGVRLLPIGSKLANERTDFNFDFLVDTRVLGTRHREASEAVLKAGSLRMLRDS